MKGYKMFRLEDDGLFPLYVLANKETPIGVWLDAEDGPITEKGKVKSRLGPLAYRPGWHIALIPNAPWIGKKVGGELVRRKNHVWCEVEYKTDIDYQAEAYQNGWLNGKWAANRAYLKHIPKGGFYNYKTNTNGDEWAIAGELMVIRVIPDEEVFAICRELGVVPQRVEGK